MNRPDNIVPFRPIPAHRLHRIFHDPRIDIDTWAAERIQRQLEPTRIERLTDWMTTNGGFVSTLFAIGAVVLALACFAAGYLGGGR